MKRTIALVFIVGLIVTIAYVAGVRHAIECSRLHVDGSSIIMELDGHIYEHGI